MRTPTCSKCSQQHYNFQDCPARQDLKPSVWWQNKEKWGNKFNDISTNGFVFFQKRGPLETGVVTKSDGSS